MWISVVKAFVVTCLYFCCDDQDLKNTPTRTFYDKYVVSQRKATQATLGSSGKGTWLNIHAEYNKN